MGLIQRFLLGNRVDDDLQVGLFLKNDGTVWLRNPDGTETQVGAGGSGLPSWFQFGAGSPSGAVVPSQKGALYQDTTNGGLYAAVGVTTDDWMQIGGGGGSLDAPGPNSAGGGWNWIMSAAFSDWNVEASDQNSRFTVDDPTDSGRPNVSVVSGGNSGRNTYDDGTDDHLAVFHSGVGMFGVTPPTVQPATPVTLDDVIALLQSYGFSA